jgi:hypothetical protein
VFHDLRDYFACPLIFAGVDPVQVARQLGNTIAVCLRQTNTRIRMATRLGIPAVPPDSRFAIPSVFVPRLGR